jgi:hypothetical protein
MPKSADVITKKYVSQNNIFADIVNYYIFDGEQKVKAENLTALDPVEMMLIKNRLGKLTGRERIRDILKSVVIKEEKNVIYVLVGVENQTDVHYAMPVRNLLYDAINYAAQVSDITKERKTAARGGHSGKNNLKKVFFTEDKINRFESSAEFLSGFGKEDKIIPVITITFYWGDKQWDAPRKLSDMFRKDDLIYKKYVNDYNLYKKYVNDYNLNLIIPSEIKDTYKFKTDISLVIRALAARNDDEEFEKVIGEEYSDVDIMTADVICELTALKRPKPKAGGNIDMCKAVEEIKRKAMDKGIEKGIEQGMEKGIDKVVISMLINNISAEDIARMTGVPLERIRDIEKRERVFA